MLAPASTVGDLASTLPCGEQSVTVWNSRGLLGEQLVCVRFVRVA